MSECNHSLSKPELLQPSESRLQQILNSLSKSVEGGDEDLDQSRSSVLDLIDFLNSISEAALSYPENGNAQNTAFEVLSQVYQYICSPCTDQGILDVLSFELPKAAARFADISDRCLEVAGNVIDRFVSMCSPRDMLSVLCDALDSSSETIKVSGYFTPLLTGLSKVFLSIQRRHFEQVKVAVPVILKVLKAISFESDGKHTELQDLFDAALGIANSIHAVCAKLEGIVNEKLRALLGLYVLQIMALVSVCIDYNVLISALLPQLSSFFPYCGLSYLGLITGSDVDRMTSIAIGATEDEEDYMSYLSYVKHGASISVIWGHISDGAVIAAKENLIAVKDELRNDQTKRWQAIGMLKHVFASLSLPWKLKEHAIDFLLCIMDGSISRMYNDEDTDCSSYMPSLFAALKAVQRVIMDASDTLQRRKAFDAFRKVLADIPTSQRFDILKALITNSNSSSMIAILLDIVKGEMHMEICKRENDIIIDTQNKVKHRTFFWTASVLELVELVLRPQKGGPPSLPEQGDAVLSALNLYRFILITESTGKTNYTGVLSKSNLQKTYNEWLLPLRTLVTGIMAENKSDCDQLVVDIVCSLNPVELVLYRCIELVEEKLKHST
ncbi:hypothetical protein FEM48_Zijuj06G0134900 [Ziziphus jujuba var. spinosa]|uniref:Aberrant root formation protein 4 n=1 Tax=Ziziphus jujuba var. spinosa TaxID=714518 RepID=A0A978V9J8_ZIZJJ|nr:aberrant root formation protein 4 isoform X1 [Ziziphus jujuba var. spinosa]KAH7524583.1 hypothetical protein FEM48_Zijuj06G0134900 [Ziziphus jujuba var. spinosa]